MLMGMIAQNKCTHNFRFLSFLTLFIITSSQIVKKNFLTEILLLQIKFRKYWRKSGFQQVFPNGYNISGTHCDQKIARLAMGGDELFDGTAKLGR